MAPALRWLNHTLIISQSSQESRKLVPDRKAFWMRRRPNVHYQTAWSTSGLCVIKSTKRIKYNSSCRWQHQTDHCHQVIASQQTMIIFNRLQSLKLLLCGRVRTVRIMQQRCLLCMKPIRQKWEPWKQQSRYSLYSEQFSYLPILAPHNKLTRPKGSFQQDTCRTKQWLITRPRFGRHGDVLAGQVILK